MKRALVISGGGSKGAFAVGILKKLFNEFPRLQFDIFVGTSTGSLIAPLVAMNEMELLEKLYTTQRTKDIILENRLGDRISENSIFDATPLSNLLKTNYTDQRYNDLLATGKKLFLTTTCLQSGVMVVYTTDPDPAVPENYEIKSLVDGSHFRRAVMASACQPVFMPPIMVDEKIPGEPNRNFQYVDGGVREYAGIQMAIDNGATEIFTILLSTDNNIPENKVYNGLFSILQKTVDIFIDDVSKNDLVIPQLYNRALVYISAVKRKMESSGIEPGKITEFFRISGLENPFQDKIPLKFFTFRPQDALGGGPGGLTFDPDVMKGMVAKGEASANDFIASLNPDDITWA